MSTELSQADLLAYMKAAIDLETQLVTQENALTECCAVIQQRKPELRLESPSGPRPQPIQRGFKGFNDSYPLAYLFIVAGVMSFGVMLSIVSSVPEYRWAPIICAAIWIIPGVLLLLKLKREDAAVDQAMEEYDKAKKSMELRNYKREQDYNAAITKCTASERALRDAANPRIASTRETLEKLYEKGYIYRKYCTLPALTSIYEYFVTGRCTELTGPHGAYNLYESELRADTIINQLSVIIANLEQIRNNQYMLYQQVCAIQQNTSAIVGELRMIGGYTIAIAQLTALNAYYEGAALRLAEIEAAYDL